jgi:agmatinase
VSDFDLDETWKTQSIFGLPTHPNPKIEILPIPWDTCAPFERGTRHAPKAIQIASTQLALYDLEYGAFWKEGIFMHDVESRYMHLSEHMKSLLQTCISSDEENVPISKQIDTIVEEFQDDIYQKSKTLLAEEKIVGVLGGEHSSSYGLIRASSELFSDGNFGVVHINAHLCFQNDGGRIRNSRSSIFWHVSKLQHVQKIVGLGIRDVEEQEVLYANSLGTRHRTYYDHELSRRLLSGESWLSIVNECIQHLPPNIHISIDIDGLDPFLCPNTRSPVPGGLSFQQLQALLFRLSQSRNIVSFDLCEVAPDPQNEWDANVGARVLYKLCGAAMASQKDYLEYV